jgi:hypothetical protein
MMYDTLDRPLLFLDVDGPLVTFRLRPEGLDHSPDRSVIEPSAAAADPLLNRFNPDEVRRRTARSHAPCRRASDTCR